MKKFSSLLNIALIFSALYSLGVFYIAGKSFFLIIYFSLFYFTSLFLIWAVYFFLRNKNWHYKLLMFIILSSTIILFNFGAFIFVRIPTDHPTPYNSRRISDLQHIQSYLETFYNTNNKTYPIVAGRWSDVQKYFNNLNDPVSGSNYVYCLNTNKQSYILGAYLSNNTHPSLKDSYHGDIQGYACTGDRQASIFNCSVGTNWYCLKY